MLLLSLSGNIFSQLAGMIEKKVSKSNFNKAVKAIEEKANRYFLKTGNEKYIGAPAGEEDFLMEDNNMFADADLQEDVLTVILSRYNPYKKEFVICESYHGSNTQKLENTKFKKLDGDVYVRLEDINNLTRLHEYVLYNTTKGLYFHYTIYEDQNGRQAAGGGFYKKTKEEKVSSEEIKMEENKFTKYNALYTSSINGFEARKKQSDISKIQKKPDDGITSPFQKENLGKLLFSNAVTEQNKFTATNYKSKFTLDEAIKVTVFLDKGLNKYIDTSTSFITENITEIMGVEKSKFYVKLSVNAAKSEITSVFIDNKTPHTKTSGVFDLVIKNSRTGNNNWVKSLFPETPEAKEYKIKAELFVTEKASTPIATGTFTYMPKPGATIPYGHSCNLEKDINDANILKLKPRLKEIMPYTLTRFNKNHGTNYTFVNLTLVSDWQIATDSYGIAEKFIYVNVLCKDANGEPFVFIDRFVSPDKSDAGYFNAFLSNTFNVTYCDK